MRNSLPLAPEINDPEFYTKNMARKLEKIKHHYKSKKGRLKGAVKEADFQMCMINTFGAPEPGSNQATAHDMLRAFIDENQGE